MTVMGRRVIPASPGRLNVIAVVIIEHSVNTQLIINMAYMITSACTERLTPANIVDDSASTVAGAPPATYVNSFVLGYASDIVVKSPDPALAILNPTIGRDLFVALSMTKTNAENK